MPTTTKPTPKKKYNHDSLFGGHRHYWYFTRQQNIGLQQRVEHTLRAQELAISVVTRAEIRYGQALLNANDKRHTTIDLLLEATPTLDWTTKRQFIRHN